MTIESVSASAEDTPSVGTDPSYRVALREGFAHPHARRRLLKLALLLLVTCVPLLLLSWMAGLAVGRRVEVPLLHDPSFYGRYLVALPLLVMAEFIVATSLTVQANYLRESGMIPEQCLPSYQALRIKLARLTRSRMVKGAILVISYVIVILFRVVIAYQPGSSSWERLDLKDGGAITMAGWWSVLVSLPLLIWLLLQWLWRALAWAWFLFWVSRFELELTPTHPDRSGGLGFLAWGQVGFSPFVAAVSSTLCASFIAEVHYAGGSLDTLKFHALVFVVATLAFLLAPLLAFSRRMAHCRFQAMLDFGMLVWGHDRSFDKKWVQNPRETSDRLLGNPDVSSLSHVGDAFERVEQMRVMPFDKQAVIVLVLAAVVPLIPAVFAMIPLSEIFKKLAVLMV